MHVDIYIQNVSNIIETVNSMFNFHSIFQSETESKRVNWLYFK